MNDHIEFPDGDDPHDQRLAELLGRVGGSTLSTEEAFARVTAKVRRVRQVRLAVSAAAVACVVGAGSLVLVRESSPGRDNGGIPLSEGSTPIESTPDSENGSTDQTNVVVGGDGENSGESGSTDGSSSGTGTTMPGAVSGGSGSSGSNGNNSGGTSGGTSGNNTGNNTGNGGSSGGAAGSTVPGGNIGAVGEDDPTPTTKAPVPTTKAPVATVPPTTVPPTVPPTTKAPSAPPTTKAPVPTVPPITKAPSAPPTTKAPVPTVPPTMAPTVPPTTTAPTAPPTLPTPPSAPVNPVTVRACGSGVLSVEVANGSFVLASLNLTVAPGFTSKVEEAKAKSINVVFESANGKITANLKVQITGSTVKHKCDVEVDSDSDESSDDDTGDASAGSTTTLPQAEKSTGNKK